MKWHKVEDYPAGSDEYVLMSQEYLGIRAKDGCIVAKLTGEYWDDGLGVYTQMLSTDRWCHIDLPED